MDRNELLFDDRELRKNFRLRYLGACSLEFQSVIQIVIEELVQWDINKQQAKNGTQRKAADKNVGPYVVTSVHTNGTVRIQRDTVNERINIRRLRPYFDTYSGLRICFL